MRCGQRCDAGGRASLASLCGSRLPSAQGLFPDGVKTQLPAASEKEAGSGRKGRKGAEALPRQHSSIFQESPHADLRASGNGHLLRKKREDHFRLGVEPDLEASRPPSPGAPSVTCRPAPLKSEVLGRAEQRWLLRGKRRSSDMHYYVPFLTLVRYYPQSHVLI